MSPFKELQTKVKNRTSISSRVHMMFNHEILANLDKSVINGMTAGSQIHYMYTLRLLLHTLTWIKVITVMLSAQMTLYYDDYGWSWLRVRSRSSA